MSDTRRILITGASRGVGRAAAEALAARGDEIVGLARSALDPSFPGALHACDLSDEAATRSSIAELVAETPFDALVNNVGLVEPAPVGDVDTASLRRVLELNLVPALIATQAVIPAMQARGWGRIVNVSSVATLGVPDRSSYGAAKAGLVAFTRTWALELAAVGVTVNAVAPGPTETDLFRAGNPAGSEGERRYLAAVPMGRLGQPGEIAAAIGYLLSEEAGFLTGQTLYIDGGMTVGRALT